MPPDTFFTPKNAILLHCKKCDFKCCKNSDWLRHTSTRKHQKDDGGYPLDAEITPNKTIFICNCGKEYSTRAGLWKHKNKCIKDSSVTEPNIEIIEHSENNEHNEHN